MRRFLREVSICFLLILDSESHMYCTLLELVTLSDKDYCVSKNLVPPPSTAPVRAPTSPSVRPVPPVKGIPIITRIRNCTPTKPCNQCEGDCDVDMDCKAGLKCFQKSGAADVPGCVGRDVSSNDFCYRA